MARRDGGPASYPVCFGRRACAWLASMAPHRRRWLAPIVIVSVLAVCGVGWIGWRWPQHDPREYPNGDDTVTVQIGSGSLEKDILPRYHVALPCDTTGVHYADEESILGPDGTLFLAFTTTTRCLQLFIAGLSHDFQHPDQLTSGDLRFPAYMRQDGFGWTYEVATTYGVYTGNIDSNNSATVVVDPSANPVVVRMEVNHY